MRNRNATLSYTKLFTYLCSVRPAVGGKETYCRNSRQPQGRILKLQLRLVLILPLKFIMNVGRRIMTSPH